MSEEKVEVGFRTGMLEAVALTKVRKNGYALWRCRCDCGGECLLDTRTLQRGTVQDCGCRIRIPPGCNDLRGRRFGRLVVTEPTDQRKYGCIVWRCVCDCGNVTYVSTHQLTHGYTKSCGCLGHPPIKDFVGRRFGNLEVIAYERKQAGMHRWRCLCDCGKETVVGQTLLQTGKTKSCGCVQSSTIRENLKLVDGTSVTILETTKKKLVSSNTSGYTGVYRNKRSGSWVAQITFKNKTYYLGSYRNLEDAIKARKCGEEMHDDFIHWYYGVYMKKMADGEK